MNALKTYHFSPKLHLGVNGDGGYVIGDMPEGYDCYISAGVANEESFSAAFIEKYGMTTSNSFAFDGSIESYPTQYTEKIVWFKKFIGANNNDTYTNLCDIISQYSNIFLKMDIEGGEYPWIASLSVDQLKKFKQITIEVHGVNDNSWGATHSQKVECLQKLANTHYLIHAHGNNNSGVTKGIPDVLELTYINKSMFESPPLLNTTQLPCSLDFSNTGRPDFNLSFYPFVNNGLMPPVPVPAPAQRKFTPSSFINRKR